MAEGSADVRDFEGVGESGVDLVVEGEGVDLGFAGEAAEGCGEDDAVDVGFEVGAEGVGLGEDEGVGVGFGAAEVGEEFVPGHWHGESISIKHET